MFRIASSVFCFLLLINTALSLYLPGFAPSPRDYQRGDELQVKVNKLLSSKTLLPYEYYFLRYCRPSNIRNLDENLGEVLRGDRNSHYKFHMWEVHSCSMACRIRLDAQAATDFKEKIDDEYRVNMIMDDLPVVVSMPSLDGNQSKSYVQGFRVGFKDRSEEYKYFIFNHLSFTVIYNRDEDTNSARIVGFEVTPRSIRHELVDQGSWSRSALTCNGNTGNMIVDGAVPPQEIAEGEDITFSYDVAFKESEVKWESRWNVYVLMMNDDQIHWFAIVNSLLIMLFLCGVVATVMIRTLYRDIASYNQLESGDEGLEETGWKLIYGDVFRPPPNLEMACVCVGSGVQILGTLLVTMIFVFLGFVFPSNRGFLMTTMVLLWLLVSFTGGYFSSRLYRTFDTTEWKRSALKLALLFPSILVSLFCALSALVSGKMALAMLWFGVLAPLVFLDGYSDLGTAAIGAPFVTKIPREIPKQPWYLNLVFSILTGGILPFVAVLVEFRFIQTFISMNRFSYASGLLLVVFVILMIMCAEIAAVFYYLQLRSEDYKWGWRAFFNGGSTALYLFVYSVFHLFTEFGFCASAILYSGYVLLVSCVFFMAAGAVGFYASFYFVRTIYLSATNDVGELCV